MELNIDILTIYLFILSFGKKVLILESNDDFDWKSWLQPSSRSYLLCTYL